MNVFETDSLLFLRLVQFQEVCSEAASFLSMVGRCGDNQSGSLSCHTWKIVSRMERSGLISLVHEKWHCHLKNWLVRISVVAQQVTNPTSIHEDAGSIPGPLSGLRIRCCCATKLFWHTCWKSIGYKCKGLFLECSFLLFATSTAYGRGEGWNPSHSFHQCHSCSNTGSLMHGTTAELLDCQFYSSNLPVIFTPVAHSLDCCCFVVSLEIGACESTHFSLFWRLDSESRFWGKTTYILILVLPFPSQKKKSPVG